MDAIFQTDSPVRTARWQYIYVHHSRTTSGNAMTLARTPEGMGDHFVIGNGDGCMDGEIQIGQRWNKQLSAAPPQGASEINKDCISICLVGDFDRSVPTPTQLRRLQQLTTALQSRLRISGKNVLLIDQTNAAAASGRYFPTTVFRQQLLP
jgi:N-acetyl-anhydromuramyl-L-alanine amidase AmpD